MMKDLNFTFLWLILLLAASMAGMSLYYQDTYGEVFGNYTAAADELGRAAAEVKTAEKTLNETQGELKIAREREVVLSGKYDVLRGEKEILEKEKKNVEMQLKDTQAELASLKLEHNKLQEDLKLYKSALVNATITINRLREDIGELLGENFYLSEQLSACEASKQAQ